MNDPVLTPEQEAEALRLADLVAAKTKDQVVQRARLLVAKKDRDLFGKTEFELRDRCHRLGSHLLEAALDERKTRATKAQA